MKGEQRQKPNGSDSEASQADVNHGHEMQVGRQMYTISYLRSGKGVKGFDTLPWVAFKRDTMQ